MGHAQAGDSPHTVGVPDRRVPCDRSAPVVSEQDHRFVVERRCHRGSIASQLPQRVALDLGGRRAPAVPAHIHRSDLVAPLGEVGHLVTPRTGQLWPAVHAEDRRTLSGHLHPKCDVIVVDQHFVHHAIMSRQVSCGSLRRRNRFRAAWVVETPVGCVVGGGGLCPSTALGCRRRCVLVPAYCAESEWRNVSRSVVAASRPNAFAALGPSPVTSLRSM